MVKSSGDYAVNWDLIEQVVLKTTETVPSCPICLYAPKAAKITRCGHVFCWPCILHYLALSDHQWRKCPICFEAIHRQDLKSVVSNPWKEFNAGDEIEMCLMRRERHSLFALPVDKYFAQVNEKHPNLGDKYNSYSNLVLASPSQVVQGIIFQERSELEAQYRDEKDEPEACFIEEALQYLSQRESGIGVPRQVLINSATFSFAVRDPRCWSDTNEGQKRIYYFLYLWLNLPQKFRKSTFQFDIGDDDNEDNKEEFIPKVNSLISVIAKELFKHQLDLKTLAHMVLNMDSIGNVQFLFTS